MVERNKELRLTEEENPYILGERGLPSDASYTTTRTLLQGKAEAFSIGAQDQLAKVFRRRLDRPKLREKIAEFEFELSKLLALEHGFTMAAYTWKELEPRFREYYYYRADKILAFTPTEEEIKKQVRWEVGEELCCLIGNKMLEDMEAGKLLGRQLEEYMKHYLKGVK